MGIKNGPAIFCRVMDHVLQGLDCADVYIDDIIISSSSETEEELLAAVRMDECAPGGYPTPTGYEQPPSGWMSARPEGMQPLPATKSRRPDGRVSAPQRHPTHATRHAQPTAQHTERAHR